ncbi:DUF4160 domain-containing protein [Pseudomonas atagonensis]|uniref:DUF4160 domain-containing protein n=1 Tax=Pseudomonas atagonensis TaxID=2609964 RepID=UPI001FE55E15|nr:DUF4160 domain-containing protein [Pseudomonas atagonensis]
MKVCSYKGLSIVIMLRDEHCPPHVHVNADSWSARLQFSFWHNDIELWDVVPLSRRPPLAVLEGLCRALEQPAHLRRARGIWGSGLQTVCLDNQLWDMQANEVLGMRLVTDTTYRVGSARYMPDEDRTLLTLTGSLEGVEIEL